MNLRTRWLPLLLAAALVIPGGVAAPAARPQK
jgi:hypothetical protein